MQSASDPVVSLCPSARTTSPDARIIGVVGGTAQNPYVKPLMPPLEITEELLSLTEGVFPEEVYRVAAPCRDNQCMHFTRGDCSLIKRVITSLPPVTMRAPPCGVRADCRWWQQEGVAACLRCPQVVTDSYTANKEMMGLAEPEGQQ